MNLSSLLSRRAAVISLFTWTWVVGSIVVSAYFAFWLFPEIYNQRTSAVVRLLFETKPQSGDGEWDIMYYPNSQTYREMHAADISDHKFLYYSACEALPLSQRPICDGTRNWKRLDPDKVGCKSAMNCEAETYRMSEDERYIVLAGVSPLKGAAFSIGDLQNPSLSDPGGWGREAQIPLFFISLFLAIRLGRSLGEFVFTPYEK